MDEPRRATPEEMLVRVAEEAGALDERAEGGRGRLHIYLGAAPGVGKTWAMLVEGRRLKAGGVDVVAGLIETHGRVETAAQIADLEVVPRRRISYRGATIEELDVDAVLARRPRVCLVDELAHTNAPGSRNEKRWQDVEELLAAGIDVLSTVNIQHLESLNDIVESITGIQVRETVPDQVLAGSAAVHLIDLHPDALRERLREGKIYQGDRGGEALQNFFRTGNLTALRELTLRRMAEGVEETLERYMVDHDIGGPWPAAETVLACVDGRPLSGQVLRHAWRIVRGLNAAFVVVHVAREPLRALPEERRRTIERNLELAEDLGAEVIVNESSDFVRAILQLAQDRNVTQIVIGHSTRSRWQELRGRSLASELIHHARGYDIHVVADRDISRR
jgi:two-component system sensor histidine kinase KdpD